MAIEPLTHVCVACKKPATLAVVYHDGMKDVVMKVCTQCVKASPRTLTIEGRILKQHETLQLPTHAPNVVRPADTFPPKQGEIHLGSMVLACPQCGVTVSLTTPPFHVENHTLKPSYICPHCHYHAYLDVLSPDVALRH